MEGIDTKSDELSVSVFKVIKLNSLDRLIVVPLRYANIHVYSGGYFRVVRKK
jgi:hypothetical protein